MTFVNVPSIFADGMRKLMISLILAVWNMKII